jgi:hypothetical protein
MTLLVPTISSRFLFLAFHSHAAVKWEVHLPTAKRTHMYENWEHIETFPEEIESASRGVEGTLSV